VRNRAVIVDVAGSIVLTALVVLGSIGESYPSAKDQTPGVVIPHPPVAAYLLVVVAGMVYVVRRRWPMATALISLVATLAYTSLGFVCGAVVVAPLIGLYAVAGIYATRWVIVLGLGMIASLMSFSAAFGPFSGFDGPTDVIPFTCAATLLLGVHLANRRSYIAAIEDRAERAERTREEEARRRVDAERLRIARELHDVVAHNISMINVQARAAAAVIPDPPPAGAQALAAIKDASGEALRELRNILGLLRNPEEAEPTAPAPRLDQLDALVSATSRAGLPTTVAVSGAPRPLPPSLDLTAYRIVQESLTNALRYAGPAEATVAITYSPTEVQLEITDNGRGDGASGGGSGHGIRGMQERAKTIGGAVSAGPRPGGGFAVRAQLPLVEAS
jgi:signal transduction histidine kinase